MIIHNLSDRGIRKQAGECDYHDPGNVALDFSYYVLQLWKFVLPTKFSSGQSDRLAPLRRPQRTIRHGGYEPQRQYDRSLAVECHVLHETREAKRGVCR